MAQAASTETGSLQCSSFPVHVEDGRVVSPGWESGISLSEDPEIKLPTAAWDGGSCCTASLAQPGK